MPNLYAECYLIAASVAVLAALARTNVSHFLSCAELSGTMQLEASLLAMSFLWQTLVVRSVENAFSTLSLLFCADIFPSWLSPVSMCGGTSDGFLSEACRNWGDAPQCS